MKLKMRRILFLTISLLVLICLPAQAQGEDGFSETFDDTSLSEWEHTQDVLVSEGALKISPGNFALRFCDIAVSSFSVKVKYTSPGEVMMHFNATEQGSYNLILLDKHLVFEKVVQETPTMLGESDISITSGEWQNLKVTYAEQQFQVYLNDSLLFSAQDAEPLRGGPVAFEVHGDNAAEFDDLIVSGTAAEGMPTEGGEEGQPPPEDGPQPEGEAQPAGEAPELGSAPAQSSAAQTASTAPADKKSLIDELFTSQSNPLELQVFLINLLLAAVLSFILSRVYIYWGTSLTNRRKFAANFMLMTLTTTFIILVVRSSVALSLGLVGALSIVRFRAAVKEPEELAYLFLAIGLGIGLGDNQRLITILAFAVAVLLLGLMRLLRQPQADVNLHLNLLSHTPQSLSPDQIMDTLRPYCSKIKLMRFDENAQTMEMAFLVELRKVADLSAARQALKGLSEGLEITFLDNKGIW